MKQKIDAIISRMNEYDVETLMYVYNEINLEILNDCDRDIYTFEKFNEYATEKMFSQNVLGSLLECILNGKININTDDYVYFDVYLHLQGIAFDDLLENFKFELENEFNNDDTINSIYEFVLSEY